MPTTEHNPILGNLPPCTQLAAYEQFVDEWWWVDESPEYALIALIGEIGEAYNYHKKGMHPSDRGHEPDWKAKKFKELGDALFYFVRICHDDGTTLQEVMLSNEKKLRSRGRGKTSSASSPG